jgi:arylsulfatase A-like enzyme
VGELVRVTDLMPTVIDLLGIESAPALSHGDGVSLANVISRRYASLDLEGYAESLHPERFGRAPVRSIRDSRFKFIDAPTPELYDLDRDPFEKRNLQDARRTRARAMKERLLTLTRTDRRDPGAQPEVAPHVRERLAALGYIDPRARPRD